MNEKIGVLFVCLGNICRSPTAEGVFRKKVEQRQLSERFEIDSAGTSSWHIGSPPDTRTVSAAATRNYDLSSLRGRQVNAQDFHRFDYILAMDEENLAVLREMEPDSCRAKSLLFLTYAKNYNDREVPDPYYGGDRGFALVLDLIEDACDGFLAELS